MTHARLPETETQFQRAVTDLALVCGWRWYHTYDSRRSREGYPDLTLWHPRRGVILLAELKRDTGQLTRAQANVLRELECVTTWGGAHLWRPSDWPEIERILRGERP